jgi:predicted enzyme related to lactoylglutathione lyase
LSGTPTWADCATIDLDAAEQFYRTVFGWESQRIEGSDGSVYSLQKLGDDLIAGIYPLNQQLRDMGVPPHWGTYIEVDDVDRALERVKESGGLVVDGPFDEPGVGRIGIIQDNVGAFIRLWHSALEHGAAQSNLQGHMTWNELATKEPEKAAQFYEAVLRVKVETVNTGPNVYRLVRVGEKPVAGILEITPEMGDFPASWNVYFSSDDVDDTQGKAINAAGKALRSAFDIAGGSRIAVLQDPQGAVFHVMKMVMPQAVGL